MKSSATRVNKSIVKLISSAAFLAVSLLIGTQSQVRAALQPQKDGIQTLVLLDDWATVETHSIFFETLRKDGHSLAFESANPPPAIKYFDSFFYDNIILMAPAVKGKQNKKLIDDNIDLRTPVSQKELIEFLDANHNLMIFSDSDVKRPVRELANKFGVEFENVVSDHFLILNRSLGIRTQGLQSR